MAELDAFFQPKSIAILGASERAGSMGGLVLRNLQQAGYSHRILAVNRKGYKSVHGVPCKSSLTKKDEIDLAVICLPAPGLQRAIKSVAQAGVRAALILTGGMARDQLSATRMRRIKLLARHWGIRLMGPNSLGLIVPSQQLNVSWSHLQPPAGDIAYIGMSSALGSALLDWAAGRGYGFSHFVTVGARADISVSDVVDYLAGDRRVKAILLHVENIRNAERFMTVLRAASRSKKVLILNTDPDTPVPPGLASRDKLTQAFFDRAGVLQVSNFQRLLGTLQTLIRSRPLYAHTLALVSNGLGPALLARQELVARAGTSSRLDTLPEALKPLRLHGDRQAEHGLVLPAAVDPETLNQVLVGLDGMSGIGAVLVILVPNARLDIAGLNRVLLSHRKRTRRTLMVTWLGEASVGAARDELDAANILNFDATEEAVQAFSSIVRHEQVQAYLSETPEQNTRITPALEMLAPFDERAAALSAGETPCLNWQDTRDLLTLFGFHLNPGQYLPDRRALERAAPGLDYPVIVRVLHEAYQYPFAYPEEARHRWRGVAIDVTGPEALLGEVEQLHEGLARYFPDSPFQGYVVQPMRRRLDSLQFSLGITRDSIYGPVLLFGLGGSLANVRADRNVALPPLNRTLARLLLRETHVYALLRERVRQPVMAEEALIDAIMQLSELAEHCPWLRGLEMNLVLEQDRDLIVLGAAAAIGERRPPVIPTYPRHWESTLERAGRQWQIRPVRAEDEPALKQLYERQPAEALRLRFFGSRLHFAHRELAAMCQIDYRREMAFVLESPDGTLMGEVRGWTHVNAHSMEFAIMLDAAAQGKGLAQAMLAQLEAFARSEGINHMHMDIMPENTPMQTLGQRMGYSVSHRDSDSVLMEKYLDAV